MATTAASLPAQSGRTQTTPLCGHKTYFVLEGINSFATTFYFYYLFFFFERQFAFNTKQNLLCAAFGGSIYAFGSWYGGRFAQRQSYHTAMKLGFGAMMCALGVGAFVPVIPVQLVVLACWTLGMSFTWPALEACVSETPDRHSLQRMVGLYNLVWAGTAALANFTGGAMLETFGPRSSFLIPALLHLAQLLIICWPRTQAVKVLPPKNMVLSGASESVSPHPHPRAKGFLRMAWLANPFAYVAMNSVIPVIPYLARKFDLSPMLAGFFISIWLFSRLAAFFVLWLWPGWHYRARWLLLAFVSLIACYIGLLVAPNLWLVMVAQVLFGLAVGLIYYSSLFYSMDAGDTKGEHGGLHEAAIGLGNFAGPAISATALYFFPRHANSGTWSVAGLLTAGLAVLVLLTWKTKSAGTRVGARKAAL